MSVTVTLDDELWLYDGEDGKRHLAKPWIVFKHSGKGASGTVDPALHVRPLPAGTEIDLDVWVKGCAGCEVKRGMLLVGDRKGNDLLRVEHSHGPIK